MATPDTTTHPPPPPQQPDPPPPQPPQPYPPQPYYPQPYPPQPYYPQPYYPSQPPPPPPPSRLHDGEVIGDFVAVGVLAATDILVRQDVQHRGTGTLVLLGGIGGGGAAGWLLTQNYKVDGGTAHATTLGLLVGAANGALLIQPTGWERPESVLGLLFLGSAVGATGGFAYGHAADLSAGQATFIGNATMLGVATAALGAITGSRDSKFGSWENGTLALGLDAGVVAGALIAPRLDWSPHRANVVFAATGVGALIGGMLAGLTTSKQQTDGSTDRNGDVVAACMTAGMWGGFGLGILMTRDNPVDPKPTPTAATSAPPTAYAPWVGAEGQLGVIAGGRW